ncbi:hypothetical protein EG68_08063, partial [Paragonimus skrjabini miyazakii]
CSPVIEQSPLVNALNTKQNLPATSWNSHPQGVESTVNVGAVSSRSNQLPQKFPRSTLQTCGVLCHVNSSSVDALEVPQYGPNSVSEDNRIPPLTLTYKAYLGVHYYPLNPSRITEEQTRYQIFLQVRSDLLSGRMQASEELFISLCGLILQSDCGDYGEEKLGVNYVRHLLKLPQLSVMLEKRIKEKHIECRSRQPALVEYQFLDTVRHCPSYGQMKFSVKNLVTNKKCLLGLSPVGITIEETQSNVIKFNWLQIAGFSRKHKQLLIHIREEGAKFTYHFAVDDVKHCQQMIKRCKRSLLFYRSIPPQHQDAGNFHGSGAAPNVVIHTRLPIDVDYLRPSLIVPVSEHYPQPPVLATADASLESYADHSHHPSHYSQNRSSTRLMHTVHTRSPPPIERPPNPYHVPPAHVYYRPRGCATLTEFSDAQR